METPATTGDQRVDAHLANFDDLDFNVFTKQRWEDLPRSHARDIVVHWPDGRTTRGIDVHLGDMKQMFTYAPDTQISGHPIKVGNGEWTAVVGVLEGTFTRPMTTPDGKTIQPTGKHFRLDMVTVAHWRGDVMDEEYLFWDNLAFMKQLGLLQ